MIKMKKAQSEIIGLGIIMVLITIGLLIFTVFYINDQPKSILNTFMVNEVPVLLNSAILDTNDVECGNIPIKTLIVKCAEGSTARCSNSKDYCDEAEYKIEYLLNETLGKWQMDYRFFAYTGSKFTENHVIDIIHSEDVIREDEAVCYTKGPRLMESKSGLLFYPLGGGRTLSLKLDLCY